MGERIELNRGYVKVITDPQAREKFKNKITRRYGSNVWEYIEKFPGSHRTLEELRQMSGLRSKNVESVRLWLIRWHGFDYSEKSLFSTGSRQKIKGVKKSEEQISEDQVTEASGWSSRQQAAYEFYKDLMGGIEKLMRDLAKKHGLEPAAPKCMKLIMTKYGFLTLRAMMERAPREEITRLSKVKNGGVRDWDNRIFGMIVRKQR